MKTGRVAESLARRVRGLTEVAPTEIYPPAAAPTAGLLDELRSHLLAGETHYTTRPGIVALRERIAARTAAAGGPRYDPRTEIVVTAGEGEAVLAAALGCGAGEGAAIRLAGDASGAVLLEALGIELIGPEDKSPGAPGATEIQVVSAAGFGESPTAWASINEDSVVVGNLDGVAGMSAYRVGYAAGPAAAMAEVMKWKQAFSICTAAPSQRAAIWILDETGGKE